DEGASIRKTAPGKLRVSQDDDQTIVEIVSDSTSQPTERFKLLRLPQIGGQARAQLVRGTPLLDVREVERQKGEPPALVARGNHLDGCPEHLAALPNEALLVAIAIHLPFRDAPHCILAERAVLGMGRL